VNNASARGARGRAQVEVDSMALIRSGGDSIDHCRANGWGRSGYPDRDGEMDDVHPTGTGVIDLAEGDTQTRATSVAGSPLAAISGGGVLGLAAVWRAGRAESWWILARLGSRCNGLSSELRKLVA